MKEKPVWSQSRLNMYKECPGKYKLLIVDEVEESEVQSLMKGKVLHRAFDLFYDYVDDKNIDPEHFEQLGLQALCKACFEAGQDFKKFYKSYSSHLDSFVWFNKKKFVEFGPEHFFPVYREVFIENVHLKVHGVVDRIDKLKDGSYVLVDYKTMNGANISGNKLQLSTYARLAEEKFGIKVSRWGILFTGNNAFVTEPADDYFEKVVAGQIEETEKLVKQGVFPFSSGPHCHYCTVKAFCPLDGE